LDDPISECNGDHTTMQFEVDHLSTVQSEDNEFPGLIKSQGSANKSSFKGLTINEIGYGKTNTVLKEISKCNSVDSSDWERLEVSLKSFLHEMKTKDNSVGHQSVREEHDHSLVSSHAPIEKSPNRRRYRAFYERK
jgi:hypothetical protein